MKEADNLYKKLSNLMEDVFVMEAKFAAKNLKCSLLDSIRERNFTIDNEINDTFDAG